MPQSDRKLRRTSPRIAGLLLVALGPLAGTAGAEPWHMLIVPAESAAATQAVPLVQTRAAELGSESSDIIIRPVHGEPVTVNGRTYDEVYRSIPFSHAEYLANPGYRHEATMEVLFNQLRPTTIVKNYEPRLEVNDEPPLMMPFVPFVPGMYNPSYSSFGYGWYW